MTFLTPAYLVTPGVPLVDARLHSFPSRDFPQVVWYEILDTFTEICHLNTCICHICDKETLVLVFQQQHMCEYELMLCRNKVKNNVHCLKPDGCSMRVKHAFLRAIKFCFFSLSKFAFYMLFSLYGLQSISRVFAECLFHMFMENK